MSFSEHFREFMNDLGKTEEDSFSYAVRSFLDNGVELDQEINLDDD